ncbi:putative zinc finger CCCH domain-containing protein 51 [Zea mays]|nr:hypothetical protein Zm00014a_041407 [Zea mays]PWZ04268.1 hypothetical protein Zm00014a_041407 [Zea mays]PWZ13608.1 hypothetical protein Zm00014a_010658 [Zea mays]PWZ13609.1 hypothetical protein Zm00014a_010658 [Zea mays]PWZ13610.1 putative zinc finger CCCH domain-containing protein 51 [Zea mays]
MDIEECRTRLQDKVRLLHPKNAEGIVDYMIANTPLENIRSYLLTATDNVLMNLFEGANRLQNILNLSEENEPLFGLFTPFDQIGPQKQHQFSSRNHSQVLQAPLYPIGPSGAFQNPYSKLTGFRDHFQSLSILDGDTPSHYKCASINVGGYPSNGKVQTKTCRFYLSIRKCKYGENCHFSLVCGYPEINDMRQVDHLGSLQMLEMEIDLLLLQPSSQVPVDHLEKKFLEIYTKLLEIDGFHTEDQRNRKTGYGLTDLFMQLNATRETERRGRYYVVLVKDAPKYVTHGFQPAVPLAGSDFNKICVTFKSESIFTHTDVQNYFSQYGTVSEERFSEERHMHGHVSFVDLETAKRIISESGPHFICGNEVRAKAFRQGRHNVVPVEDAPKYMTGGFVLEMPPASSASNKIFITFNCIHIFTHTSVQKYFSQYGTVNEVIIPIMQKRPDFGFVSFLDSESVKQILSERGPHFICGNEVHVKAYREKHELE